MPIYEYQCLECGKRTEVIQRMDDPPLATCPSCNGPVKKLISSPAFQFKGSGWYVTDYARGGSGGGKEGGKSSEGGEGGSESKQTEKSDKADKKESGDSSSSAKETPSASSTKGSSSSAKD